ncbi:MAG: prolipoprotein diacylglyceryl transferase [Magnetococcales bacterium]|nr:prolipoprotein diacylglyceryl transferase [Magnetococcales bacterium]
MIAYPEIDPIIVEIGPLAIRWYGVMYSLAFILGWPLLKNRAKRLNAKLSEETLGDLLLWVLLGVVLGGRIGYVIFYQPSFYISDPLAIFRVWEGGMAFHGGLLGVIISCCLFARRNKITCSLLVDMLVPIVPLGLLLGRIGNFINGELWGRVTDVSWGMVFPGAGYLPRHPSQLYEALLEGVVLFAVLWWLGRKARPPGYLFGVFILGYGICRFIVEFFREPDAHLGFLSMGMTMGQWLSLPMLMVGAALLLYARSHSYKSS